MEGPESDSYAEWRSFVEGRHQAGPRAVAPVILESWKRSREHGVDPFSAGFQVVSPEELERRRSLKAELCKVATPYINNLYDVISGSGSLIVLSDEEGVIIDLAADVASHAIRNFPEAGTLQSESVVGTNGIGTALACKSLVQICGAEHWLLDNHSWTCNAAPILVNGQVVGALNLSTPSNRQNSLSSGFVKSAVTAIARELELSSTLRAVKFLTERQNAILRLMESGVIFVSREGDVIQSNEQAHAILRDPRDWRGMKISDVMRCSLDFLEVFRSGTMLEAHEISLLLQRKYGHIHVSTEIIGMGEREEAMAILIYESRKMVKMANKIVGATARFRFTDVLHRSQAMADCVRIARQAATSDSSVLIMGESGTGKELIAQSIHNASDRRDQPFVAVNCGALSRELILSELFGYEGGAFTGAKANGNPGKFELAEGGTIFLDEIGELPLESQVALLRVLQTKEVTRIGSARTKAVNVRVIAATNRELGQCVAEKTFREDLFFRIDIISIRLPPLRERRGDIRPLVDNFLKRYRGHASGSELRLTEECLELLEAYAWPGNIRQLENVIERAVTVCEDGLITSRDLPREIPASATPPRDAEAEPSPQGDPPAGHYDLDGVQREFLKRRLIEVNGNLRELASKLSVSRSTVYRMVQRFCLAPAAYRGKPRTS